MYSGASRSVRRQRRHAIFSLCIHVRRCRGPQLQLTKRAPLGGDSETRTLKGPGEATWASRRAVLASLGEPPSRRMGHFQQVHAAAPLTRRTKSSSSDYLARQIELELRACCDTLVAWVFTASARSSRDRFKIAYQNGDPG